MKRTLIVIAVLAALLSGCASNVPPAQEQAVIVVENARWKAIYQAKLAADAERAKQYAIAKEKEQIAAEKERIAAEKAADAQRAKDMERARIQQEKEDGQQAKRKAAGLPVMITGIRPSRPNSAGGVDAYVYYTSISEKPIKYLIFSVKPYNAVGDVVASEIGGKVTATLKEVGPIRLGEKSRSGNWPNVWYNHSINCLRMTNMKVVYMDGNVRNFSGIKLALAMQYNVYNSCSI